jgi:hypothetical protein
MITKNLFNEVLIKPVEQGADKLLIVSGYATSAMAFHHLEEVRKSNGSLEIDLIVGMPPQDGLSLGNHRGFQKIVEQDYAGKFQCSYVYKRPAVHSKIYTWLRKGKPVLCYNGSANYSQNAFRQQREALAECDPSLGLDYFNSLSKESIYCNHGDVENYITIFSDHQYFRSMILKREADGSELLAVANPQDLCVRVSLLDRTGHVPSRSGLNWGQRPELHRNPNQAYLQLSPDVYKSDFFPPKGDTFTVLTDDGVTLLCSRAQKRYGEAIQTPQDNSLLGEYFRNRLGLGYGAKVEDEDLGRYGRNDIEFCKNEDETYYMDFSV